MTKGRSITVWIISVLLAAVYLLVGGMKLAGSQTVIDEFVRYGYAGWFMYVVGAMEVTGAILLLIPRSALYGAIVLSVVMIGAMYTHLTHQEALNALGPLVLFALLAFVAASRRETVVPARA
jgi:putative oxidoreductase